MEEEQQPETPVQPVAPTPQPEAPIVPEAAMPAPAAPPAPPAHSAGTDPVAWSWPSIHPEAYRYAGVAGALTALGFLAEWGIVPWLLLALTGFILAFFRDPKRASPAGEGILISPADGLVSQIMDVELPRQLVGEGGLAGGTATRISVFMSVFDVHINRTPLAGIVKRIVYVPGAFLNADLDKASEENERQYFVVEAADGTRVGFTQIAGLIARRIIAFVHEGEAVSTGQRVGLIRFGSRVDIFLPAGFTPQVVKGQRAVAGETVLAVRGGAPAVPGPRQ
jgi:phosphatidylserine decarboxylase